MGIRRGDDTASPVFIPANLGSTEVGGADGRFSRGEQAKSPVWGNLLWPWPAPLRPTVVLVLRAMYNVVVVYLGTLFGPGCGWEGATGRRADWLLGKRAKRGGGEGECTLYNQMPLSLPLPHARTSTSYVQFSLS